MKQYKTPSLKAEELKIADVIAVSNMNPHFVKEGTSAAAAGNGTVEWNTAWQVD